MPDRSLVEIVLQDPAGTVRPNKALTFFEEDGTTPLAQPLYAQQSGGSPVTAPAVDGLGTARYYAAAPQRAVCKAADDAVPFPVAFEPDPVDLILMDQQARRLASLTVGPDTAAVVPLAVRAQVGQTAALQEWRDGSGAVLASIGQDSSKLRGTVTITGTVTAAKIQAAVDADLGVIIPEGTHDLTAKITLRTGSSIRGMGSHATVLRWTGAASGVMFEYAAGSFTPSHLTIADLDLYAQVAGVTGIRVINGGFDSFHDLFFRGIATHFRIEGGFGARIRSILVSNSPTQSTGGSYFYAFPHLDIDGFTSYSQSSAGAVLTLAKIAVATVSNVNLYAPNTVGIALEDDCQGVIISNTVMTSVTTGVVFRLAAGVAPSYCELLGVKIDQATVASVQVAAGAQIALTRCELTFTAGSADGLQIGPFIATGAVRTRVQHCTFEGIGGNGILAVGGAGYFSVVGCTFIGIGTSGTGSCLAIGAGVSNDVYVAGNWMRDAGHGTISDGATSGARRYYLDNIVDTPIAFANPDGAVVREPTATGQAFKHGPNGGEVLSLRSSAVAHGMTGITSTDTYGMVQPYSASDGGLFVRGLSDTGPIGLGLQGFAATPTAAKSVAAAAAVMMIGSAKSGTSATTNPANSNLLAIADHNATRFIFDSDGEGHCDTGTVWTNFDARDDLAVLEALAVALAPEDDPLRAADDAARDAARAVIAGLPGKPLVAWNDEGDERGHHFLNTNRLAMLLVGALRQVAPRLAHLEARLAAMPEPAP